MGPKHSWGQFARHMSRKKYQTQFEPPGAQHVKNSSYIRTVACRFDPPEPSPILLCAFDPAAGPAEGPTGDLERTKKSKDLFLARTEVSSPYPNGSPTPYILRLDRCDTPGRTVTWVPPRVTKRNPYEISNVSASWGACNTRAALDAPLPS